MALSKFEKELLTISILQSIEGLEEKRKTVADIRTTDMDNAIKARRDLLKRLEEERIL